MRLMIRRVGSALFGTSDTIATSAGSADAGKVPHLGTSGLLSGTMTMLYSNAGAPTDGTTGTGHGVVQVGALLIDTTNHNLYINANTQASPTWKLMTRAA